MDNEQQRVDVLAVMRFDAESSELGQRRAGVGESAIQARMKLSDSAIAAVAELIEAHKSSVDEIERLRDAMFRVYAVAANGGDTAPAIELMRDEMDKPWSVDRSRAALANVGAAK